MATSLTEALMALGELSVDLSPDPAVLEELSEANKGKRHLILRELGVPRCRYVYTGSKGKMGGTRTAIGRSLAFLLGTQSDGPTIVDREWVSQVNRLSNGLFEFFGADALDPLYWSRAGDSEWNFGGASVGGGNYAAVMLLVPEKDDILESTEHFAVPSSGSRWEISAFVALGSALYYEGWLALRITYEGRYQPVDVALPYGPPWPTGWNEYAEAPDRNPDFTATADPTGAITGEVYRVRRSAPTNPGYSLTDTADMSRVAVIPGRTYRWELPYRIDPGVAVGEVRMSLVVQSPFPRTVLAGPTISQDNDSGIRVVTADFTIPPGCHWANLTLQSSGIFDAGGATGPAFWLAKSKFSDTDLTTKVSELIAHYGVVHDYELENQAFDTPPGTTSLFASIVAGPHAYAYTVDGVQLRRVDSGPTAAQAMVRDLLKDPLTGLPVVEEGTIYDAGNIGIDTRLRNVHLRTGIDVVSMGGLVQPSREWTFDGDGKFSWGLPTELYQERPNLLLRRGGFSLVMLGDPEVTRSIDSTVDGVRIIGADRPLPDGSRRIIEGAATGPYALTVDAFGRPLRRTRVVQDSTADSTVVAQILAAHYLDRAAEAPAIQVEIPDPIAYDDLNVGDWLPIYDPELGLEDATRPMQAEGGETVWPLWLRVLARTCSFTRAGMQLVSLDPASGDEVDLTEFALWSDATTQRLDLGNLQADFTANPEGGAVGQQFLRYRAGGAR